MVDMSARFKREVVGETEDVYLTPLVGAPTHTLIWMHGYNQTTTKFEKFLNEAAILPEEVPGLRVIIPMAP